MQRLFFFLLFSFFLLVSENTALAAQKGHVYQHPTGLSFWYPQSWRLQELDEAFQLIPNDAVSTAEGPSEVFFVSGESVAGTGIMRADDPQVISYVDQQVQSILPGMQLQPGRDHVDLMGTQGLILRWSGNNNSGKAIEGRAYIVIAKGYALTLSAIAFKGLIDKRDGSLKKIFRSFAFGEGQLDQALVGTWNKHATASLANPDRIYQTAWTAAQSVSEDKSVLTFYPDGRWHQRDTSHMLVGAAGLWLEDKSDKSYEGRWFADGKRLFMIYKDNTWEDFAYKVVPSGTGRELRTSVGKKATIWRE